MLRTLDNDEQRRHEQHREAGRSEHSGEDRDVDGFSGGRSGAIRKHERQNAERECGRRHEDRSETGARSLDGGIDDALAGVSQLAGDFDDQDRVLRRKHDEQDEIDLCVEIDFDAQQRKTRTGPTSDSGAATSIVIGAYQLVLHGQHEGNEQQCECEHEVDLTAVV